MHIIIVRDSKRDLYNVVSLDRPAFKVQALATLVLEIAESLEMIDESHHPQGPPRQLLTSRFS